jgi:hypothetical protein
MNDDLFKKLQLQEMALQRAVRELQPWQNIVAEQERITPMRKGLRKPVTALV